MSSALSWELFKPSSHLKAAGNAALGLFMLMLPTSYQAASHNDLGSWIFLHLPSLKHQHQLNSIAKWTSTNNTDTATLTNHNRSIISLLILRTTLQSGFLLVPQSPPIIKELRLRTVVHSRLKIFYSCCWRWRWCLPWSRRSQRSRPSPQPTSCQRRTPPSSERCARRRTKPNGLLEPEFWRWVNHGRLGNMSEGALPQTHFLTSILS